MTIRRIEMSDKARMLWAFAITSIALFMTTLDNLVVTTALPVIRRDLHASLQGLEWTVNAYTLTFAVLLLTGAALGDRFGRRRLFVIGLGIFTGASAMAALASSANELIVARAIQGLGGAIVLPLTLTILSAAVPPKRRGLALGAWGGIGGLAVALGPLVGGAVVQGLSWQWIFWLNVPFGLILIPLALTRLQETHGSNRRLDLPGLALSAASLFAIVWGLVRGNQAGWASIEIVASISAGVVVLALFVLWELRAKAPMLPMRFFRNITFTAANIASLFMFFGMFGSIFLLAQYFQTVQGASPLQSGLRILPWTAMPIFIAPIAGLLSDKIGGRPIMATGLALQATGLAWIGAILTTTLPYSSIVDPVRALRNRDGDVLRAGRQRRPLRRSSPRRRARHRAPTTPSASSAASSASQSSPRSSPATAATRRAQRSCTASRLRSTSAPPSSPSEQRPPCSSRGSASPRPKPHTPCPPVSSRPSSRQRPRHLHPSRPGASRSGPEADRLTDPCQFLTGATGLEPATSGVTGESGTMTAATNLEEQLYLQARFASPPLVLRMATAIVQTDVSGHEWATGVCLLGRRHAGRERRRGPRR